MPRSLLDRIGDDSVDRLERAARHRFKDATVLHDANRRMGAIYLYGYAVECLVKSGYFRLIGFSSGIPILPSDRRTAMARMKQLTPIDTRNQHHIAGWTQLLVAARSTPPFSRPYPPQISRELVNRAMTLYNLWSETLRYSPNNPYKREVDHAAEIAGWFVTNYRTIQD